MVIDVDKLFKKYSKYLLTICAIYTIGWGITESKSLFLSLLLGTVGSLYMMWTLSRRVKMVSKGRKSIGMINRFAMAALCGLLIAEFPHLFMPIPVVIGLMTFFFVITIDFLVHFKLHS